ncbi:MAG: DEAD/DEAH box helicase family protein, partial [Cytophagales bacterium]|nr:DEAD/DEAH box helicase family protein [Cytophagales bacterium]
MAKLREGDPSESEKGRRFELLMQRYLKTTGVYAHQLSEVWLWNDFPCRKQLGGKDLGIDLVGKTKDGKYWAIQCKFFQEDTVIDKKQIDSFLSASSRQFKSDSGETAFSFRLLITSSKKGLGKNAKAIVGKQTIDTGTLGYHDLEKSDDVDWKALYYGKSGEEFKKRKEVRDHQLEAIKKTHTHFKKEDKGKLIMACGTGKTFTSLRIAEKETGGKGLVLFLVPSIALISQSLRGWSSDVQGKMNAICVCSDEKVKRSVQEKEDLSIHDIAFPTTTDQDEIARQLQFYRDKEGLVVVFSTYQSLQAVIDAQQALLKETDRSYGTFDLIICDEAHRTTGVVHKGEEKSHFVKVHDTDALRGRRRLFMTATPRLYGDAAKSTAAYHEALLWSMDDEKIYGTEIYSIGFGDAVEEGLLCDFKVIVLALDYTIVPRSLQESLSQEDGSISLDDQTMLIGCIQALSKQLVGDHTNLKETDPSPMRTALAFCHQIKNSKAITKEVNRLSPLYLDSIEESRREQTQHLCSKHIDGKMNAQERNELLDWLKDGSDGEEQKTCRMLSNVRCLSEGIDVPALDAVIFMSPRNSQVDVVQTVGRVMRRADERGKKYGYIIIPVVTTMTQEASVTLDKNPKFKVVWQVLNALRAHDERFDITINKMRYNNKTPENIIVATVPSHDLVGGREENVDLIEEKVRQMPLGFEAKQRPIYGRAAEVGERLYYEEWAKEMSDISVKQKDRVQRLIQEGGKISKYFKTFFNSLRANLNPSISENEAIE